MEQDDEQKLTAVERWTCTGNVSMVTLPFDLENGSNKEKKHMKRALVLVAAAILAGCSSSRRHHAVSGARIAGRGRYHDRLLGLLNQQ